jgi:hypothetical protein
VPGRESWWRVQSPGPQTLVAVDCPGLERLQYRLYIKLGAREGGGRAAQEGPGRALALEAGLLEREVETLLRLLPALRAVGREQGEGAEGQVPLHGPPCHPSPRQVKLPVAETMYGSHHPSGEGVLVSPPPPPSPRWRLTCWRRAGSGRSWAPASPSPASSPQWRRSPGGGKQLYPPSVPGEAK